MDNRLSRILILDALDDIFRSWWTVVAGISLGIAASLLMLQYMPRVYEASARLNLSSRTLPGELFRDTVAGDEDPSLQLAQLRDEVFSERYLRKIIEEVFPPAADDAEAKMLMARVRSGVRVVPPTWSDYFEIRYRDSNRIRAARVANMLAENYVEENFRFRVKGAEETSEALEALAAQKWEEIQETKRKINEFRARNTNRTEADQVANTQMLADARDELEAVLKTQAEFEDQISFLEAQQAQEELSRSGVARRGPGPYVAQDPVLLGLEREMRELRIKYADSHPDVVAKQKEIEAYKALHDSPDENPVPETVPKTSATSYWTVQLRAAQSELSKWRDAERRLRGKIAQLQGRLASAPRVQSELDDLSKGLSILQGQYDDLKAKAEDAKSSEMLEKSGRGSQFKIMDAASPPSSPVSPKPPMVVGVGVLLGLLLFVGPLAAKPALRPVVSSEARLVAEGGAPILVTIPTLPISESQRRARRNFWKNLTLSGLAMSALAVLAALNITGIL